MLELTFHKEYPTGAKVSLTFNTDKYRDLVDFKREVENFKDVLVLRYLQNHKDYDLSFEFTISSTTGIFKLIKRSGKLMCDIESLDKDTLKYTPILNVETDADGDVELVHKILTVYELVFKDLSSFDSMLKDVMEDIDGYSLEGLEEENVKDVYVINTSC